MNTSNADRRKAVFDTYQSLIDTLGTEGKKAHLSTRSLDIETVGSLNSHEPLQVTEVSMYNPAKSIKQNTKETRYYNPGGTTIKKELHAEKVLDREDRFLATRVIANRVLLHKSIVKNQRTTRKLSIGNTLKNASKYNIGVYNLNFEASVGLENLPDTADIREANDLVYSTRKGTALSNRFRVDGGNAIGNDIAVGKLTAKADSLISKFRSMDIGVEGLVPMQVAHSKARDASIAAAELIAKKVGAKGKGTLFDQATVAQGYIAKMQKQGLIEGQDWISGLSVDSLLRAGVGMSESHLSSLDSAGAQSITSHMIGVLNGDDHTEVTNSINARFSAVQQADRSNKSSKIVRSIIAGGNDDDIFYERGYRTGTSERELKKVVGGQELLFDSYTIHGTGGGRYGGATRRELFDKAAVTTAEEFSTYMDPIVAANYSSNNFIDQKEGQRLTRETVDTLYSSLRGKLKLNVEAATKIVKPVATEATQATQGLLSRTFGKLSATQIGIGGAALGIGFLGVRQMISGIRSSKTDESAYGGFEVMQPNTHSEFPGGRLQTFTTDLKDAFSILYASISKKSTKAYSSATELSKARVKQVDKYKSGIERALDIDSPDITYNQYMQSTASKYNEEFASNVEIGISNHFPRVGNYFKHEGTQSILLNPETFKNDLNVPLQDLLNTKVDPGSSNFYHVQATIGHELTHARTHRNIVSEKAFELHANKIQEPDDLIETVMHNASSYRNLSVGDAEEEVLAEMTSVPRALAQARNPPAEAAYGVSTAAIAGSAEFNYWTKEASASFDFGTNSAIAKGGEGATTTAPLTKGLSKSSLLEANTQESTIGMNKGLANLEYSPAASSASSKDMHDAISAGGTHVPISAPGTTPNVSSSMDVTVSAQGISQAHHTNPGEFAPITKGNKAHDGSNIYDKKPGVEQHSDLVTDVGEGHPMQSPINTMVSKAARSTNKALKSIDEFVDPNKAYRIIQGDSAYQDIVESGLIRTNASSKVLEGMSVLESLDARPTKWPSFNPGSVDPAYAGANPENYIIEVASDYVKKKKGRHYASFPFKEGKYLEAMPASDATIWRHVGDKKYQQVDIKALKAEDLSNVHGGFHGVEQHSSLRKSSGHAMQSPIDLVTPKNMVGLSLGVAAIMSARSIFDFINPNTYTWGRASQFGGPGQYMWGNISEDFEEDMDAQGMGIVTHGTYIHEKLQKEIEDKYPDIVSEYAVIDYKDKITGHIDMVAPVKLRKDSGKTTPIPIEIKTTSSSSLSKMTSIKPEHVAQSQFYLHHLSKKYDTNVPYEAFIYVARDNPNNYKVFYEKRDERLYQRYLKRYRAYQEEGRSQKYAPKKMTSQLNVVKEQIQQTGRVNAMHASPGMAMDETMDIVTQAAKAYQPTPFNRGISRSDSHYYDYDSPLKPVWKAPSAQIASEFAARTPTKIKVVKPKRVTKLPMNNFNNGHTKGQHAKYSNRSYNSRPVNPSRMGVA